jgi:hypothetical protein
MEVGARRAATLETVLENAGGSFDAQNDVDENINDFNVELGAERNGMIFQASLLDPGTSPTELLSTEAWSTANVLSLRAALAMLASAVFTKAGSTLATNSVGSGSLRWRVNALGGEVGSGVERRRGINWRKASKTPESWHGFSNQDACHVCCLLGIIVNNFMN